ncbi:MAG: hypothetical protein ACI854_002231, partial [Arenicella sp.]
SKPLTTEVCIQRRIAVANLPQKVRCTNIGYCFTHLPISLCLANYWHLLMVNALTK